MELEIEECHLFSFVFLVCWVWTWIMCVFYFLIELLYILSVASLISLTCVKAPVQSMHTWNRRGKEQQLILFPESAELMN